MNLLMGHEWSGNVRELENTIESILVINQPEAIDLQHLPKEMKEGKERGRDGERSIVMLPTVRRRPPRQYGEVKERVSACESALNRLGGRPPPCHCAFPAYTPLPWQQNRKGK